MISAKQAKDLSDEKRGEVAEIKKDLDDMFSWEGIKEKILDYLAYQIKTKADNGRYTLDVVGMSFTMPVYHEDGLNDVKKDVLHQKFGFHGHKFNPSYILRDSATLNRENGYLVAFLQVNMQALELQDVVIYLRSLGYETTLLHGHLIIKWGKEEV